jgi:hypothetical protein
MSSPLLSKFTRQSMLVQLFVKAYSRFIFITLIRCLRFMNQKSRRRGSHARGFLLSKVNLVYWGKVSLSLQNVFSSREKIRGEIGMMVKFFHDSLPISTLLWSKSLEFIYLGVQDYSIKNHVGHLR